MFIGSNKAEFKKNKVIIPASQRDMVKIGQQYFVVSENDSSIAYEFENDVEIEVKILYQGAVSSDYTLYVPEDFLKKNRDNTLQLNGLGNKLILCPVQDFDNEDVAQILQELGL